MKIISLSYSDAGYACSIATSINKRYNTVSNFFDYLIVDMKTINDIFYLRNLELLLNNYNFEVQGSKENITVIWNNFSKMISYHDLKNNYDEKLLNNFKSKYLRRYHRLMNDIYNEKIIFFIRFGKTKYDEIRNFINNIKNINNKLILYFINVDYDNEFKDNIYYDDIENYIYINFSVINNKNLQNDDVYFRMLECNWDFVFSKIEEINIIHK